MYWDCISGATSCAQHHVLQAGRPSEMLGLVLCILFWFCILVKHCMTWRCTHPGVHCMHMGARSHTVTGGDLSFSVLTSKMLPDSCSNPDVPCIGCEGDCGEVVVLLFSTLDSSSGYSMWKHWGKYSVSL